MTSPELSESPTAQYERILRAFCQQGGEELLYEATLLSESFIAAGILPDEIVAIHNAAVTATVRPNDARALVASQQMLLEMMIGYGVKYSEYSELRAAEAQRAIALEQARAEAAERADQDRLALLEAISHELGTPLSVIKGNVAAIRQFLHSTGDVGAALSLRATDAEAAVDRMIALRGRLLSSNRQDEDLEMAPVHLGHAINLAARWAQDSAESKSITLTTEIRCEAPFVLGDEEAIQSVLTNLISNAIRYTPDGGTVQVTCTEDDTMVQVDVQDNGIGLSEYDREHIFDRFYRGSQARKMASVGIGLGLTLTKALVEALGGSISVTGEPGVGSTFTIRFPLLRGEDKDI